MKLIVDFMGLNKIVQPPSGGCVLKLEWARESFQTTFQPPSGGCVLKPVPEYALKSMNFQPPSGGCVLKPVKPLYPVMANRASRLQAAVC